MLSKPPVLLRRALWLDAVGSGAVALLLTAGSDALEGVLGLSAGLLRPVGIFLIAYVAAVVFVATREQPQPLAKGVIAANAAWAVASFGLLASGSVAPTTLGTLFVAAQALAVAGFGALQLLGLKKA